MRIGHATQTTIMTVLVFALISSCGSTSKRPSHFKMEKYYLDVITKDGNGAYFHSARANLQGFDVQGRATNLVDTSGLIATYGEMRSAAFERTGSTVRIHELPRTQGPLTFDSLTVAESITLYEEENGSVTWEAFACDARVTVTLEGQVLAGSGYAERLTMTIPPWKLPLEQHWWGRTIIDSMSLVWLVWEGPHPLTIGLINGKRIDEVSVTEDKVVVGAYEIRHHEKTVLSEGSIMTNALGWMGDSREFLPWDTWDLIEHRWINTSTVQGVGSDSILGKGWTLHERIEWRNQR